MNPISRRLFLRGAGAAVGLPLLNAMGCARLRSGAVGGVNQAVDTPPKRLVIFFSPNGTILDNWRPTGSESSFTLAPILQPLQPHQNDLLILDGIMVESARHGPGDDHQKGMSSMLTGIELLPGTFVGGGGDPAGFAGGISIDQEIANRVGGQTKFKSLELGVQVDRTGTPWTRMCYAGADQPLPAESDPYAAFTRIFGDLTGDPSALIRLRAQRRTVLDAVARDYETLKQRLGSEDQRKLEVHAAAIRDIETRLDAVGVGDYCRRPELGTPINVRANANFPAVGRLQMDLLVMALACDLTRVASLQWSNSVSGTVFSWLDIPDGHHELSHHGDEDVVAADKLTRINTWYAQQLAYLIAQLKQIPEGSGTLFDNTVILWCNELAKGNAHSHLPLPFVLAGSAGRYFRTGRFLTYNGEPHNNLLVSLANAMGVPTSSFGNPAYCTGPLANLR